MLVGYARIWTVVARQTEQVYGNDAAGGAIETRQGMELGVATLQGGNRGFQYCRIHVEGFRIDIHKHGNRPQDTDDFSRGYERERRSEDGVSGAYAVSHQTHEQRIGTRRAGYRVFHADVCAQLFFQRFYLGSHDVLPVIQNAADVSVDLSADARLLCFKVDQFHWKHPLPAPVP